MLFKNIEIIYPESSGVFTELRISELCKLGEK